MTPATTRARVFGDRKLIERRHLLACGVSALLLDGLRDGQIAAALGISQTLVNRVVQRLYRTFGVWRRPDLKVALRRVQMAPGELLVAFADPHGVGA